MFFLVSELICMFAKVIGCYRLLNRPLFLRHRCMQLLALIDKFLVFSHSQICLIQRSDPRASAATCCPLRPCVLFILKFLFVPYYSCRVIFFLSASGLRRITRPVNKYCDVQQFERAGSSRGLRCLHLDFGYTVSSQRSASLSLKVYVSRKARVCFSL